MSSLCLPLTGWLQDPRTGKEGSTEWQFVTAMAHGILEEAMGVLAGAGAASACMSCAKASPSAGADTV
eukprot:6456576-Amphidinium_carterae.2